MNDFSPTTGYFPHDVFRSIILDLISFHEYKNCEINDVYHFKDIYFNIFVFEDLTKVSISLILIEIRFKMWVPLKSGEIIL